MKLKPPFIITSTLSPGLKIGDSVAVQVERDGKLLNVNVTLGERSNS